MTLQDLRQNGKDGNWIVVTAIILVSALEYGNHSGLFHVSRKEPVDILALLMLAM